MADLTTQFEAAEAEATRLQTELDAKIAELDVALAEVEDKASDIAPPDNASMCGAIEYANTMLEGLVERLTAEGAEVPEEVTMTLAALAEELEDETDDEDDEETDDEEETEEGEESEEAVDVSP